MFSLSVNAISAAFAVMVEANVTLHRVEVEEINEESIFPPST